MVRKSAAKTTAASEAHADSASESAASPPQRVIKKYPNRRLYDETDSKYINFSDLHQLILDGKEFKVLVNKTNEDQTLQLMLQIFLDLELGGQHLFSDESLRSLIVLRNSPSRQFIDMCLKNTLSIVQPK
jgi:polyhydroxyalkanoate synthesis repressor PhaR